MRTLQEDSVYVQIGKFNVKNENQFEFSDVEFIDELLRIFPLPNLKYYQSIPDYFKIKIYARFEVFLFLKESGIWSTAKGFKIPDNIHYSFSYSQDLYAFSISNNLKSAIDIQHYQDDLDVSNYSTLIHNEIKKEIICSENPAKSFIKIWCLNEAFFKLNNSNFSIQDPLYLLGYKSLNFLLNISYFMQVRDLNGVCCVLAFEAQPKEVKVNNKGLKYESQN